MTRNKIYRAAVALLFCMTILSSCSTTTPGSSVSSFSAGTSGIQTNTGTDGITAEIAYEDDDYYFSWKDATHTTITLNGGSITVTGSGAKISGSTVTITASGTYEITGTLTDGSIVVDVDKSIDKKTVFLVLNGADISSQTSAPIYIKNSKKTVLLLEPGTKNSVYGGSGCIVNADSEPSAAIFSKSDLTISGSGTLNVKADYNDGITSKNILKITDGTLTVIAKSDGIAGKDSLNIEKAIVTVTAGKDGMRSTNDADAGLGNVTVKNGTFTIDAAGDAISAFNILEISDGTYFLTSGGGYPGKSIKSGSSGGPVTRPGTQTATATTAAASMEASKKGLKAGQNLIINGGSITISSYEDAVHSNLDLSISNASLTIQAGDDAIHAENNMLVDSGTILIKNSYEGIEGTNIKVKSGKITLNSTDDGFNVNNSKGLLTISGGEISVAASGDGLDSNGSIIVTGGTIYVDGPTANNDGALDYDSAFTISGGILVASGSSGMAEAPTASSTQFSILMFYTAAKAANTAIILKDANDTVAASFTPAKQYSSVAISAPDLKIGETYTLYSGNAKVTSFKITSAVTYLNESGVTAKPQTKGPGGR